MRMKSVIITLFVTLFFVILSSQVQAQDPDEIQEVDELQESTDEFLTETYDLTWPDLLYEERTLEGQDETWFGLFLPGNIVPAETGSYVDLVLSHTTPQTEENIDLTVIFNNSLLDIIPLTEENADRALIRLDLPGDILKPGRNELLMRLNAGGQCGEVATTRIGAVIHTDSMFHVEYELPLRQPDLAIYPLPFYERTFEPSEIYFVFPKNPTVTDISTAASISAGLGIYSGGQVQITSILENELTDDIKENYHLIVIGLTDNNNLLAELDIPFPLDNPLIKEESGVLQEIVSPWNPEKMVLVATAHTDTGLLKAGDVLNRDLNFLGMKGPIAVIEEVLPPTEDSASRDIDVTFDSLGYEDAVFLGTREQDKRFDFWMPLSWEMAEDPKLYLSLTHSTVIDPETSSLSVQLNGVPVGGTLLNSENAIDGVLEMDLPIWLLRPGRNTIQVNTEMLISEGDPCANLNNQQAWTVIRRDSFIHLPYLEQDADFNLALFPYPFNANANLTDVSFVLPETLSSFERDRLLRLAVSLGQQARGERITLRAISAQDIDDTIRENNHLIVFGRPTTSPFLRDLNEYLPQPFKPDTDQLQPKLDSAILTPVNPRSVGLLQMLDSPWNSERAILAITGTTDEGVSDAFNLLLGDLPEEVGSVRATGNLSVIEENRVDSTDTRLLNNNQVFFQQSTRVEPVARTEAAARQELADRWW